MSKDKRGNVLIETILGMSAWILVSMLLCFCLAGVWLREFLNAEVYYLARAALYGNLNRCEASTLIPQELFARKCFCSKDHVECRATIGKMEWAGLLRSL